MIICIYMYVGVFAILMHSSMRYCINVHTETIHTYILIYK